MPSNILTICSAAALLLLLTLVTANALAATPAGAVGSITTGIPVTLRQASPRQELRVGREHLRRRIAPAIQLAP